jgi:predicted Zn-dependent peptidase
VSGERSTGSSGGWEPIAIALHADTALFIPDTVFAPEGGPTVAFFTTGSTEVVSIRASVPFREGPEEAGVAQLIRVQARDRMRSLADRIGATADAHRTAHALVYQVSGSVQDLDFLAWILQEGMSAPQPSRLEAARREVLVDLARQLETPEGTLSLRLRDRLSPGTAPIEGRIGVVERLDHSHLSAAWTRSHLRSQLNVVIAGRLDPTVALAAVSELGIPDDGPRPSLPPPATSGERLPAPEVIRHWIARGYPVEATALAAGYVTARHLAATVRMVPGDYEVFVELWDLGPTRAIVVSGAAYDRGRQAMQQRLDRLLSEAADALTPEGVGGIVLALQTELQMTAQTPPSLAGLAGQSWDAGADARGLQTLWDELARVEAADVRRLLERMSEASPAQEELRP